MVSGGRLFHPQLGMRWQVKPHILAPCKRAYCGARWRRDRYMKPESIRGGSPWRLSTLQPVEDQTMNLRHELEILRRRFWNGDRAARDSLHHLLERYVAVFVRRALANRTADSPIARDARRIAAERRT